MPSVPRELPPTLNLTCCLCEAMLRAPFLTPKLEKGTVSHGNLPPPSAPEGPQPPHHNGGENWELGPGLEEDILLPPSTMMFTTPPDALYQRKNTPSLLLKSLSTAEAPSQRVQIFAIFVGIHWLTAATGLVQESSTSSFVPAPAARGERDEEGS